MGSILQELQLHPRTPITFPSVRALGKSIGNRGTRGGFCAGQRVYEALRKGIFLTVRGHTQTHRKSSCDHIHFT